MKTIVYLPGHEPFDSEVFPEDIELNEIEAKDYKQYQLQKILFDTNPERVIWVGLEDKQSLEFLAQSLAGKTSPSDNRKYKLFQGYVSLIIGTRSFEPIVVSKNKRVKAFAQINNLRCYDALEDAL